MKTIILCGGTGTRMKEETEFKPKPLVEVGGKPILWHIMKIYAHYGYNEFVLALGYKGDMIKQHFLNWRTLANDFTLDTQTNEMVFHNNDCDDFKITFAETGATSLTGERVRRLKKYLNPNEDFMITYGDGVANINLTELLDFHKKQDTLATITGVRMASRYGLLNINHETSRVVDFFQHKVTQHDMAAKTNEFINGGFMVLKPQVLDMIEEGSMIESVFSPLTEMGQLSIYRHHGKWKAMDTYKEVEEMNDHWKNDPFWKIWTN